MLLKLEIYLSIAAPNDMDTFGSRNFGHKSYKIILNKKPLILYIFFCYWQFHYNKSIHSYRERYIF